MFDNIKKYFSDLKTSVLRGNELAGFSRKDIAIIREGVEALAKSQHEYFVYLDKHVASIYKKVTSMEMEMLLNRGACLDNSFEGKQEM
jgi:hypothetical protein